MSGTAFQYINNTGVIVPDTASLLGVVQDEWTGALTSKLSLVPATPQGILIAAETEARSLFIQNNAALANQINPNIAGGIFLDAIAELTGLERSSNTFTTVAGVRLAGALGAPVATGSLVKDSAGNQFSLAADVTLDPATGAGIGTYVATVAGPVTCATGAMTIVTAVLGLETVVNPGVSVSLGSATQPDESFRVLRRNTLFLQGVALIGATLSAINNVNGVIGSKGLENVTGTVEVIQGVTLADHSIWVCVDGGSSADISAALLHNKSTGADWNGAQTANVIEPTSGQHYTVRWDIPTPVPILVRVTCKQGTFSGNPATAVVQAVLDFAANDINGIQGIALGGNVSPFEVATGIMAECPGLYVSNVQLSLASVVNYQPAELAMLIFQKATIPEGNISVVLS